MLQSIKFCLLLLLLLDEIRANGRRALALRAGITQEADVLALFDAFKQQFGRLGILVNGVAPGLVDTGFDPLPDDVKAAHAASLPMKRLGQPEDMTSAFVFPASGEGRYYCGQLLHPNGGEIMP